MKLIRCCAATGIGLLWVVAAAHAAPYSDAVLATDGLVVYYRMNENPAEVGDALVNEANPGTLNGVWGFDDGNPDSLPMSGIEGPGPGSNFGGLEPTNVGAWFGGNFADDNEDGTTEDNVADQMDLADLDFLDALDNEFATIALFMKTDVDGNDSRLFTTAPNAAHPFRLVYGVTDFTGQDLTDYGAIAVSTGPGFDDPASNQQTRGAAFGDDQWHHIVVVRNGDDARNAQFYYDGQDISGQMVDVGDSYGASNETPRIGARHGTDNPGTGAYQGNLDEFAYWNRALTPGEVQALYEAALGDTSPMLQAGDANMDLAFNQFDIIQVQQASKYLTGQPATWGDGDWNGAPGGSPGSPPQGDGVFDQLDIVAALTAGLYLQGPYAAIGANGQAGDAQTSVGYDANTGRVWVDPPAGKELTSINMESAAGIFTGQPAENLGGSFDNDTDTNIFKATFGASFGAVSFGNVAQPGLDEQLVLGDLTIVGSLAGGGDLGSVDLIYVPEPSTWVLLALGLAALLRRRRSVVAA